MEFRPIGVDWTEEIVRGGKSPAHEAEKWPGLALRLSIETISSSRAGIRSSETMKRYTDEGQMGHILQEQAHAPFRTFWRERTAGSTYARPCPGSLFVKSISTFALSTLTESRDPVRVWLLEARRDWARP